MHLLVAVINQIDKLDEVLAAFLDIGITGATILDSEGMSRILVTDISVFAGLQSLAVGMRPRTHTMFSVMQDDQVDAALALLQQICGSLEGPSTGIAFTLPVDRVVGLAPPLKPRPATHDRSPADAG